MAGRETHAKTEGILTELPPGQNSFERANTGFLNVVCYFFFCRVISSCFQIAFAQIPPITTPTISRTPSPLPILSRVAAMKVELKIPNPTSLHGCQLLDQLSCPQLITLKIRCQSSMQHNSSAQKLVKPAAELPDFGEFVACVCVGVFIIFFFKWVMTLILLPCDYAQMSNYAGIQSKGLGHSLRLVPFVNWAARNKWKPEKTTLISEDET